MDTNKDIAILLSTYNGEAYLEAFLNSIISQTNREFILLIRDDGSSDGTTDIVHKFTSQYSNFIFLESKGNLGSKLSFGELLEYALSKNHFNYFMFADQDDVWLDDKISVSIQKIKEMEGRYLNLPILIHTDLIVVDEELNLLADSFWKYQHLNPKFDQLNRLIMQNVITGCTVMFNHKLAKLSYSIPDNSIMHDWWIGLVASAFGKIGYIAKPTIYYRQHSTNTLGAKKFDYSYFIGKMLKPISLDKNISQAKQFHDQYLGQLTLPQKELIIDLLKLRESSYIYKIKTIIKWKLFKIGIIRNIGLLLKIR
jgi:glycosyltransferase involved in cell wall biosynthesis